MLAQVSSLLGGTGKQNINAMIKENSGIYHLAGGGYCSRLEWAREVLRLHGLEHIRLIPGKTANFPSPATRPLFSALNCQLFERTFRLKMPDWKLSLNLALSD